VSRQTDDSILAPELPASTGRGAWLRKRPLRGALRLNQGGTA